MDKTTPYLKIAEHFDEGTLGAPKVEGSFSEAFIDYLKLLYTPEEAELVQHLRMMRNFTTAADVASVAGKDEEAVKKVLDDLLSRSFIVGLGGVYALPEIPLLVNIHQFRLKAEPEDLEAARLYQQFFIKDGFYKYYESSEKGTPLTRVIPVEAAVEHKQKILDTEEAHRIIDAQSRLALVPCPCRTRTEKMGVRECADKNPVGDCIMMGNTALHFESVGLGKNVSAEEAKRYVDEMQEKGLVNITDNWARKEHTIICSCCECCCSQVRGRTRWENPHSMAPSNYVAEAGEACILCGVCEERCFFGAICMDEGEGRAVVDPAKCMGCGVCTHTCPEETMKLRRVERSEPFPGPGDLYRTVARENKGIEA
jgi:Pyruvate/2-oxoacid:ferredoxin oxidoreductase delta subunit